MEAVSDLTSLHATSLDPDDLLARARQLVPVLRARSNDINKARQVPTEVIKLLGDPGLMQLTRPSRYGGREVGVDTVFRVT
jgi:3-hydroxy-9,10-secoandrosta-1,3,5(10)-triene-9,17-dione monooxygenase